VESGEWRVETPRLTIRKAVAADAPAVQAVRDAAILSACAGHYSATELGQWTGGPIDDDFVDDVAARFYVASIGNRIVAIGCIDLESANILAVFVLPDCMRRGIGRAMLAHLEQLASDAGLSHLTLESTLNAAPFYRACGYVGDKVSTYHSPRGVSLACVPMAKALIPAPRQM
jgi:GNAT superfamily N-acetyltransferase